MIWMNGCQNAPPSFLHMNLILQGHWILRIEQFMVQGWSLIGNGLIALSILVVMWTLPVEVFVVVGAGR